MGAVAGAREAARLAGVSILVTGRTGQVSRALIRAAETRGAALSAIGRPELDLEHPAAAAATVSRYRPRVLINAAAFTAVDKAEEEIERARQINGVAAGALAEACAAIGAPIIQVSTDYVFAGDKGAPYVESDPTSPQSAYGHSKLLGEQMVGQTNPRAIVVRTAWVYDASGANFVRTMLRLAKSRNEINVVADQLGCPTFADDLADALLTIASDPAHTGVYHCAGAGETNWAVFATEIFAQSRARGGPHAVVKSIATSDYPTRARRPANSRLDCRKLTNDYGVRMRDWRDALAACMDEIAAGGWRVE